MRGARATTPIRGGIIDVYPVTANQPYRLDFFGDEIEDIREFDPVTQRSGATASKASRISASPRVQARSFEDRTGRLSHVRERISLSSNRRRSKRSSAPFAREGTDGLTPLLEKCAAAFGISDLDEASGLFDE